MRERGRPRNPCRGRRGRTMNSGPRRARTSVSSSRWSIVLPRNSIGIRSPRRKRQGRTSAVGNEPASSCCGSRQERRSAPRGIRSLRNSCRHVPAHRRRRCLRSARRHSCPRNFPRPIARCPRPPTPRETRRQRRSERREGRQGQSVKPDCQDETRENTHHRPFPESRPPRGGRNSPYPLLRSGGGARGRETPPTEPGVETVSSLTPRHERDHGTDEPEDEEREHDDNRALNRGVHPCDGGGQALEVECHDAEEQLEELYEDAADKDHTTDDNAPDRTEPKCNHVQTEDSDI